MTPTLAVQDPQSLQLPVKNHILFLGKEDRTIQGVEETEVKLSTESLGLSNYALSLTWFVLTQHCRVSLGSALDSLSFFSPHAHFPPLALIPAIILSSLYPLLVTIIS